jgi:hypothetical protein
MSAASGMSSACMDLTAAVGKVCVPGSRSTGEMRCPAMGIATAMIIADVIVIGVVVIAASVRIIPVIIVGAVTWIRTVIARATITTAVVSVGRTSGQKNRETKQEKI